MKEDEEETGRGGGGDRKEHVGVSPTHVSNPPPTLFRPTHAHVSRARAHPVSWRGDGKKKLNTKAKNQTPEIAKL